MMFKCNASSGSFASSSGLGHEKFLKRRVAVNVVYDSSSRFAGPSNDVPVVEDEIVEEDTS